MFMIRRAQGRLGELLPAVLEAVERHPALGAWRAALPLAHLAAGDERQARLEHDRTLDGLDAIPRDFFWLASMTLLAEASAALRATGAAERLYGELAPFASRWVQIGYAASDGPWPARSGCSPPLAATRREPPRTSSRRSGSAPPPAPRPSRPAREPTWRWPPSPERNVNGKGVAGRPLGVGSRT